MDDYPPLGTIVYTRTRGSAHVKDWDAVDTAACLIMATCTVGIVFLKTVMIDCQRAVYVYTVAPEELYATQEEANAASLIANELTAKQQYVRAREAAAEYANRPARKGGML